jgi:hypothetical protein
MRANEMKAGHFDHKINIEKKVTQW